MTSRKDNPFIINHCSLMYAIQGYAGRKGNSYLDELPALHVIQCLLRTKHSKPGAAGREDFLLSNYPKMDSATRATFVYITEGMTYHAFLNVACYNWDLFLQLVQVARRLGNKSAVKFMMESGIGLHTRNGLTDHRKKGVEILNAHLQLLQAKVKDRGM